MSRLADLGHRLGAGSASGGGFAGMIRGRQGLPSARAKGVGEPGDEASVRVTMINKYYPPHLGGIENHVRDLAQALASREGFVVEVLVANEARTLVAERVAGVSVVRLPRLFAYSSTPVSLGLPWAIRRAARTTGLAPDKRAQRAVAAQRSLIHLHFPFPWGEVSWLLARSSLPTVLTYHSDIVRQEKLLLLYRPLLQRILERVDLILVSSPNMVEHSEFLRPVAAKCRVVPFGVDVDRLAGSAVVHAKAKQLRAAHHRPVVLFVGRLVYYKGVDVLVRAIAEVDADLVLVGRGPLEHQLRVLAAQLGATERLTFLPYLESDDLTAWYHAADLLCLPSVARAEAFGLVQLEAQAAGTPVVSTRLATGVPFVNRNNVTGFTVTPGDPEALAAAMRRLLEDEQLRLRLGRQARDRVRRQFTSELMVKRTVDVYQEALMEVMRGGLG